MVAVPQGLKVKSVSKQKWRLQDRPHETAKKCITELVSRMKHGSRGKYFMTCIFFVVDRFFFKKKKKKLIFPDKLHLGRGGVGVIGLGLALEFVS